MVYFGAVPQCFKNCNQINGKCLIIEYFGAVPQCCRNCNQINTKCLIMVLKPYLHKLFNVIILTGTYPGLWGEGFIVPVFEKGDTENLENYRGITFLSVVGKLLLLF